MAGKPVDVDYHAMGIWLRTSPGLRATLESLGKKGVEYAKSIAPVGNPKASVYRTGKRRPGLYRDSIGYEIHQGKSRMSLRLVARDQKAHWIEYGSKHMPKYAVLRRALDYLKGQM